MAETLTPSQKHQERRQAWYSELLANTPCAECGESYPANFMGFDYDQDRPEFEDLSTHPKYLAQRGYSEDRIVEELAKGRIYCAWHRLEIATLREHLKLAKRFNRRSKELEAQLYDETERKVRIEYGLGESLADQLLQEGSNDH